MEMAEQTLAALAEGQTAVVRSLRMEAALRRRLMELGLIPGTRVRCLLRAPGGSPVAYEICGAMIALRRCDAAQIGVCAWD